MKILIKFASRSRKNKFFNCLDNIISTIGVDDYIILASLDVDDTVMANKEVNERIKTYGKKVVPIYAFSTTKVDAINRDIWLFNDWDILINFSDDQLFIVPDFGKIIIEDFTKHFPNGDGVLHYPDANAGQALMTMSIMDIKYYNRFKYIYNESYHSLYCDNEAMLVAQRLNRYAFENKRIFNHNHPVWTGEEMDEQYKRTESFYHIDKQTYGNRLNNNFYL